MSVATELTRKRSWQFIEDSACSSSSYSPGALEVHSYKGEDAEDSLTESKILRKFMVFPSAHGIPTSWREESSECESSASEDHTSVGSSVRSKRQDPSPYLDAEFSRLALARYAPHKRSRPDEATAAPHNLPDTRDLPCVDDDGRFACPWPGCNVTLYRQREVHRHLAVVHNEPKYKCEVCGRELKYKFNLKTHMNIHKGLHPFLCRAEGCLMRFNDGSKRRVHERREHPNEAQTLARRK